MITRSRSRRNKDIQNNIHNLYSNMSTNTSTQSNAMEFEINNQLGDPDTLADISGKDQASGTLSLIHIWEVNVITYNES